MDSNEEGYLGGLTIGEVYADMIGVGDSPRSAALRGFWDALPQKTAEVYRAIAPHMLTLYEEAQRKELAPANRKLLEGLLGEADMILAARFMFKAQDSLMAAIQSKQSPGMFPYHDIAPVLGRYWFDAVEELFAVGHLRSGLCPDPHAGQLAAFLVSGSVWVQDDNPEATADSVRVELEQLFMAVQFHAFWGSAGGARILLRTHELAAALMMSESAESVKVNMPFSIFELVLPDSLIEAPRSGGDSIPLTKVWVMGREDSNPDLQDAVFVVPYGKGKLTSFNAWFCRGSAIPYLRALYNLISGVCLSMSDADFPPEKIGKGHKAKREANRDVFGNTLVRSWRLGRPVDTGYRRVLKEFLTQGKGAPRTVQWWRRGQLGAPALRSPLGFA